MTAESRQGTDARPTDPSPKAPLDRKGVGAAVGGVQNDGPAGSTSTTSQSKASAHIELETPTRRGDVIAGLFCFVGGLGGYFFVVPAAVYVPAKFAGTANSPAFLPNVLFILLAALSAIYLAQGLTAYLRETVEGHVRSSDWALAGGTATICVCYVGAIYLVGMTVASALCVAAAMFYFGERRLWAIGSIAVILPIVLWYFFVKIAHILFPTPLFGVSGWLELALFSDKTLELAHINITLFG